MFDVSGDSKYVYTCWHRCPREKNIINMSVHKTGWDFGTKQYWGSEVAEIVSVCRQNRIGFTVRLISHRCGMCYNGPVRSLH